MDAESSDVCLLPQEHGEPEQQEDTDLYPFVCGICDNRFNRINEYVEHFELHSDMVTKEYFHSCLSNPESDIYDTSSSSFHCGVCWQFFPTLCSLHDHFCRSSDRSLYIIDADRKTGVPKHRRCVGSIYTGNMDMADESVFRVIKTEAGDLEDDGDDDMEDGDVVDEESEIESPLQMEKPIEPTRRITRRNSGKLEQNSEMDIGIKKITVKFGNHSETYDIELNKDKENRTFRIKAEKNRDVTDADIVASESEADEDMSDMEDEDYSYGVDSIEECVEIDGSPKKRRYTRKKIKSEQDSLFHAFEKAEEYKSRRGEHNIPVPADQMKDYMAKAEIFGADLGENTRVCCPVCTKVVLRSYLTQHFKKIHSDEQHSCDVCGKIFSNKGYRTEHKRLVHEGRRKSRGNGSGKSGARMSPSARAILDSAMIVGEEDGANTKVQCPVCNKLLLRHYLVKHNRKLHSDKKFPCNMCDKVFPYNGYLADHKRYVHDGKKKKSMLTKYAKEPGIIQLCDSAQPVVRQRGEKPKMQCPKCEKIIQQEYLAKHLRSAHSDEQYPCETCGKVYTCKRFLYDHKKYVHMEKDTQCEVCLKWFKGLGAKDKHKRMIHTDAKPFQCETCGGGFRTSVDYNRHKSQHQDLSVFCYQCPKCERRFKTHKAMNCHMRSVHRRAGRLQCKWPGCDRILNDRATFKKHYCIHTGEKPNKCPLCDRAFIQRVALRYHLKTKHKSVDQMPPGKAAGEQKKREAKTEHIEEIIAQPVPLYHLQTEDGVEYTELESTPDGLTDSAIVSNLIEIAQSSEGVGVPEAIQHVLEGGDSRTIVIYYQ